MATYTVTRVRKVLADDYSHRHIEGVCTDDDEHYTRSAVIESINAGDTWTLEVDGFHEVIKVISACPHDGCTATPYIETKPMSPKKDNLEYLDLC